MLQLAARQRVAWIALGLVYPSQQLAAIGGFHGDLANPTFWICSIHFWVKGHHTFFTECCNARIVEVLRKLFHASTPKQCDHAQHCAHGKLRLVYGPRIYHGPEHIHSCLMHMCGDVRDRLWL